jgi:hypothetical protein
MMMAAASGPPPPKPKRSDRLGGKPVKLLPFLGPKAVPEVRVHRLPQPEPAPAQLQEAQELEPEPEPESAHNLDPNLEVQQADSTCRLATEPPVTFFSPYQQFEFLVMADYPYVPSSSGDGGGDEDDGNDLPLARGDVVEVLEHHVLALGEGWALGRHHDTRRVGFFPLSWAHRAEHPPSCRHSPLSTCYVPCPARVETQGIAQWPLSCIPTQ